jgi:ADP-ribosylglycohydrolase
MLGGAVGDALGAPVEFSSRAEILRRYGADGVTGYVEFGDGTGAITDDTQMTLFTADALIRDTLFWHCNGIIATRSQLYQAYSRWMITQGYDRPDPHKLLRNGYLLSCKELYSLRSPGISCISGLLSKEGHPNPDSKGCGAVMRAAPIGLFCQEQMIPVIAATAAEQTHGHPTSTESTIAFALLIAKILDGVELREALREVIDILKQRPDSNGETVNALTLADELSCEDILPHLAIARIGEGWVAEEALAISVYCALNFSDDFRQGVLAAVNITGDSDSTGAITGNILGTMLGETAIPAEWLNNLRERHIVEQIAEDIFTKCELDENKQPTQAWCDKYPPDC